MFLFFLTCSSLVVSRKFPAVSSGDLKGRQSNARQRTFNSEFRLKRDLRLNKQVIPASPSRKRYSRYVFSGPEKRSLNSETSDQDRKVRLKSKFKVFLVFVRCILSTQCVEITITVGVRELYNRVLSVGAGGGILFISFQNHKTQWTTSFSQTPTLQILNN